LTDRRYTPTSYTHFYKTISQGNTNMQTPENNKPVIDVTPIDAQVKLSDQIKQASEEIAAKVIDESNLFAKPTLAQRAKRIGGVALKVGLYSAGAAALGGIAWVGYKALKGTPAEAVADAVGDAAAAVADAVAAALR
jgi:hypothetical protein